MTIPSIPTDERLLFPVTFFLGQGEVLQVAAVRRNLPWLHLCDPAALDIHLHTLGSESTHLEGARGWAAAPPLSFMSPGVCSASLKLISHSL